MSQWLNFVSIALPRNASTTHTLDPSNATGGGTVLDGAAFTFTAGRMGVMTVAGGVTTTTPTSWTLPTGGSAVANSGVYLFYRASLAGSDTMSVTHNGTNYPIIVTFFELAAGSAFVKSAARTGIVAATGANPALTALAATPHWLGAVKNTDVSSGVTYTSGVWTGTPTPTELVDRGLAFSSTDGYGFGLSEVNSSSVTSWTPTDTVTGSAMPTAEALTFAFTVSGRVDPPKATVTAAAPVPAVTAAATVSPPVATVTAAALVPVVTGGSSGSTVNAVTATATAAAPAPAVQAASTVSPPVATVAVVGKVPAVTAASTVTAVVAVVTVAAPVPLPGGGVGAPLSTVTVVAFAPTVTGGGLLPPTATVTVSAPAPAVAAAAISTPPAAAVTVAAPNPAVSGGAGDQSVAAPTATATAAAPVPGVAGAVTISPPVATVAVAAPAPSVSAASSTTPPAATVTAQALAPTAMGAATVASSLATVAAAALAPDPSAAASISPPVGLVNAQAFAPLVTGGGAAGTVAPPPALVNVQAFAPVATAPASITAALAMVGAIAYVTLVQGAAALITPTGATLAQAKVPTVTAGAVVSPPPAGIASGNWEAYPPRVIGTSNSDPADFYRTRWPQWLPTMMELKIAISASSVSWLYPNKFLEGCTKSDLVYICRVHSIPVAGLPGV